LAQNQYFDQKISTKDLFGKLQFLVKTFFFENRQFLFLIESSLQNLKKMLVESGACRSYRSYLKINS